MKRDVAPSAPRDPATELACGAIARALEPRAVAGAPERTRVRVRADGLGGEDRALAEREPDVLLRALDERTLEVDAEPGALARLASESPPWACIAAAAEAAARAPAEPVLMGVVNVTPDSFSDGGEHATPAAAAARALALAREGAAIVDVGGESTRPGARPVPPEREIGRVEPAVAAIVEALGEAGSPVAVSVDTRHAAVAARALERGASIVNDVSAGRDDPEMLGTVAAAGARYVAMHMRGRPRDMQLDPRYRDPVAEIAAELRARLAACAEAGIPLERVAIDPGIGFGKGLEHNLALIARLRELRSLGRPLCLGVSRKSFLGRLTGREDPRDRMAGTAAAVAACTLAGAEILRVHDLGFMADVVRVSHAIARAGAAAAAAPTSPPWIPPPPARP